MKKSFFCIVAFTLSISLLSANSNDSKAVSKTVNKETEVMNIPQKHQTDAVFLRAYGAGDARHLNTAKIKARMVASAELTTAIQAWMKGLLEKYLSDSNENTDGYMQDFEEKSLNIIGELVGNAAIASDNTKYLEEDNLYNVSLVLEVKRKKIFDAFNSKLATEKKWEGIYNRQKFQALYDAEIKELKRSL